MHHRGTEDTEDFTFRIANFAFRIIYTQPPIPYTHSYNFASLRLRGTNTPDSVNSASLW